MMAGDQALSVDAAVIGGGSAGLAAACALAESGYPSVLVVERERRLGGVLPQCVHDGFGLHLYGASLTGPEYARRWIDRAEEDGVRVALNATVLSIAREGEGFSIEAVGASLGGRARIVARCVVVATGCRERTRGALQIPGGRPAGILTAGTAQYMMNVADQLPGDKAVILGSGDIGLIMARRLVLEGAEVRMVLGQEATGLLRNHIRCIQDFSIPFRSGWGVARIHGFGQLQGVTVAPLDGEGGFDLDRAEYIRCNLLLLACGLIPEREVLAGVGEGDGLYVCGNANLPHDLVDQVTQEGLRRGFDAACRLAELDGAQPPELPGDLARMAALSIAEPKGRLSQLGEAAPAGVERIVCTVCPTGCVIGAGPDGEVSGNACARGAAYAARELACPHRLFTGTVKVEGAADGRALAPVRTDGEVPQASLRAVACACRRLTLRAPVALGQTVAENVAGTGARLVAADDVASLCGGDPSGGEAAGPLMPDGK